MTQNQKNYIYGTSPKKIEYDVYEENKVLKSKKKAKSHRKIKIKSVGCILVVFFMFLAVITRYAQITELNYQLNKTNKQYVTLKNENSRLKAEIDNQTDLNKIRELAESRIGMHKPDKYQIVYIKVPKNDFTKVIKDTNSQGSSDLLAMVTDKISELTRLLQ